MIAELLTAGGVEIIKIIYSQTDLPKTEGIFANRYILSNAQYLLWFWKF